MMKRTLLLLAGAVLLCALPLRAQDGSRFLQSLAERLHRTPKAYDTSYVRKLDLPWTASVSTDLIRIMYIDQIRVKQPKPGGIPYDF